MTFKGPSRDVPGLLCADLLCYGGVDENAASLLLTFKFKNYSAFFFKRWLLL